MKIGIVSDTHGRAKRLRAAMRALADRGAQAVVHCGDVGSEQCVAILGEQPVAAYLVLGNTDRDAERLMQAAERCGVRAAWEVIEVPIGAGAHLVATHGHDASVLGELIADGQFPYVCHGHTHKKRDQRIGRVRVINPGALHFASPHTAAALDTDTDTLEYIVVGS